MRALVLIVIVASTAVSSTTAQYWSVVAPQASIGTSAVLQVPVAGQNSVYTAPFAGYSPVQQAPFAGYSPVQQSPFAATTSVIQAPAAVPTRVIHQPAATSESFVWQSSPDYTFSLHQRHPYHYNYPSYYPTNAVWGAPLGGIVKK